jgi:dTDP-4-dehydrorhamnose reductase
MRILVTGASGLLGINLALEASWDHEVYGLVHSNSLQSAPFAVIQGDLRIPGTAERILDQVQPDWVIHCAALANLDACEADPAQAKIMNTEIPRQLAKLVARGGARLLHVSTDSVFDGRRGNYGEEDQPHPLGVYSLTKLEGEYAVAKANPEAIIARVVLYGFSISSKRSLGEFFLYNLLAGKQVRGFTDVYFCPLLANDLAQIFLKMLALHLSGIYHVVSQQCMSKYAFGVAIAHRFDLDNDLIQPVSVEQGGLAAARSPNLTLRSDKLAAALGEAPPDILSGLEKFHQLYLQGYPARIRKMAG